MINRELVLTKTIAAGKHLLLSLLIFSVVFYLIHSRWYPGLLFDIDGGWQGVRLTLTLFLATGPLLTWIIIDPNKSQGKTTFDLVVILILQLGILSWGLSALNKVRPLALSYHNGVLQAVLEEDFQQQPHSTADLLEFGKPPVLVYTRKPDTAEEKAGVVAFEVTAGISPHQLFFLFEPLSEHYAQLDFADPEQLTRQFPEKAAQLKTLKGRLVKYQGRYGKGMLVFDQDGKWVNSLVLEKY